MVRLSDFESELTRLLRQLLTSGGSGNFLVVSVGPAYLQFAASPTDRQIHFEAVSDQFLPPDRRLSAVARRRLEKAGFVLRRNYERALPASGDADLLAAAREAVTLLRGIYGCAPDAEVEVQLELEDIAHPSNEALVAAMEAARQDPTEATGEVLFRELLRSTLLLPVDEDGAPSASVGSDGSVTALVFTDYPSLLASKSEPGYQPLAGPRLIAMALDQGVSGLIVSSGTEPALRLTRSQLEALVEAARRD